MEVTLLATIGILADVEPLQQWMAVAFYPVLLGILVIASLGIPIPEDFPLIMAGVILRTQPGIASWHGACIVALIGIMTGDLVLYTLGKWWGPGVVAHRFVRRLITPSRFARLSGKFRQHGVWMVFFGRFFMGVRAAMCITAGATRYPYWRFFAADFAGALLSVPFFIALGYFFAGMLPTLLTYVEGAQWIMLGVALVVVIIVGLIWRRRRLRRRAAEAADAPAVPLHPEPTLQTDAAPANRKVTSKPAPVQN